MQILIAFVISCHSTECRCSKLSLSRRIYIPYFISYIENLALKVYFRNCIIICKHMTRDGEVAVNSTVNSKAFDSTNPIYIFARFCYTSFGNSRNAVTNSFVAITNGFLLLLTAVLLLLTAVLLQLTAVLLQLTAVMLLLTV